MNKTYKILMTSASILYLTACGVTVTSKHVEYNSPVANNEGLLYFLPQRMMKVTATRTPVTPKKLAAAKKAFESAQKAFVAVEAKKTTSDKLLKEAKSKLKEVKEIGSTTSIISKLKKTLVQAEHNNKVDIKNLEKAKEALAKKMATYKEFLFIPSSRDNGFPMIIPQDKITLKVELMPAEPDASKAYLASPNHSAFRDDKTNITVNERGLLSSSKVTAEDRTGDILVDLAGVFGMISGGLSAPAMSAMESQEDDKSKIEDCPFLKPMTYEKIFDPTEGLELQRINYYLGLCFSRQLHIESINDDDVNEIILTKRQKTKKWPNIGQNPVEGYVYRMAMPYTVNVLNTSVDQYSEQSLIVMLPNKGPTAYIPMKSAPFVKTVDDVTFKDGSILSWDRTHPSEVAEIVRLPLRMAKAIVEIPAELIQLKFNISTAQKDLAEGQAVQIKAQIALQVLQACLTDAEEKGTSPSVCAAD